MDDPLVSRFAEEGVSQLWYRERGQIYFDRGETAKALQQFQAALKIRNDARTHHNIGLCYLAMRQFGLATRSLKTAVDMAPHNAVYLSDLGDAFLRSGNPEGEQYLRQALGKKPAEPLIVSTLGQYLICLLYTSPSPRD